ncbi:MAG: histidinol-phosphate aminotransferase family protein [Chloroflexi bacterium]|nr:histidinol-phosphate aminotransferase family protein [Chloroflexota bacterium]
MGTIAGVTHGALDHAELTGLGLFPDTLLDFSSNINPFGPPPGVRAALAMIDPAPYPDRSCLQLRRALARCHDRAPGSILPGNGANELIHLIAYALLQPGDGVLIIGPTYGEYAHVSRLMGARVVVAQAHAEAAFQPDAEAIVALVRRLRPRLTWLCTPNNPTGVVVSPTCILALVEACAVHGGYLVLDRAYRDFQRSDSAMVPGEAPPGLIELHSLTKGHALAGLRLGYLLATPDLAERIGAYQPAWSVSSAAQVAGLAALADPAFLQATIPQLWTASDMLYTGISELGLRVWRAALPFLLVQTGDGAATRAALLRSGCVVRDCASFGLPEWVRVAPRRLDDNERLLTAWKESL